MPVLEKIWADSTDMLQNISVSVFVFYWVEIERIF